MSTPYVGEMRSVGFNFAPQGWAFCDGSQLAISQFEVLFVLIGTTYGGNGTTTFNLPDMRGRVPVHQGGNYILGVPGGAETVNLITPQLPAHAHTLRASTAAATTRDPTNNLLATPQRNVYGAGAPTNLNFNSVASNVGGHQPHNNIQPYLAVSFVISLFGVFPSQG